MTQDTRQTRSGSRVLIGMLSALFCLTAFDAPLLFAQGATVKPQSTVVIWETLSHEQKVQLISNLVTNFKAGGKAAIRKEPAFYVDQIEYARRKNPALVTVPVGTLLRALAISYDDFDNGRDRAEFLREELGEKIAERTMRDQQSYEMIYRNWLAEQGIQDDN